MQELWTFLVNHKNRIDCSIESIPYQFGSLVKLNISSKERHKIDNSLSINQLRCILTKKLRIKYLFINGNSNTLELITNDIIPSYKLNTLKITGIY